MLPGPPNPPWGGTGAGELKYILTIGRSHRRFPRYTSDEPSGCCSTPPLRGGSPVGVIKSGVMKSPKGTFGSGTPPKGVQNLRFESFLTPVPPYRRLPCSSTPLGGVGWFDHREDSQAWQGSGAKLDIYAFPLSIKSQTITAKRAGKAEKAVAANKFNAGT